MLTGWWKRLMRRVENEMKWREMRRFMSRKSMVHALAGTGALMLQKRR